MHAFFKKNLTDTPCFSLFLSFSLSLFSLCGVLSMGIIFVLMCVT